MLKLLFLEFLYNLSDEEIVARAETDLAFMWFLGVLPEDHMPDASSLTRFRRDRLGLQRSQEIRVEVVEQCKAKGLVGTEQRVIVDSTDMAADATVLRCAQADYQEAMSERKAIEHKQAEEVRFHGLRRARYRGLVQVTIQAICASRHQPTAR